MNDRAIVGGVFGVGVDIISHDQAIETIAGWAKNLESRYVCAANAHMTIEARDNIDFMELLNNADMVIPDGMPLVWVLRTLGYRTVRRLRGPDLMLSLCKHASVIDLPVALYGGREGDSGKLVSRLSEMFPGLRISCVISPPFRSITSEENQEYTQRLNESQAGIIFVGIGCPKQEYWMASHKGDIQAVMIGVGAAFDFISGTKSEAPMWMRKIGMEWFYRLISEPRRLWRRYIYTNSRFLLLFAVQLGSVFFKRFIR